MTTKSRTKSAKDAELRIHRDWLSTLQPVGLVVSPPALVDAQVFPDRNISEPQRALVALFRRQPATATTGSRRQARKPTAAGIDFVDFARDVLGWPIDDPQYVLGGDAGARLPDVVTLPLPEFGETLRPTYAVVDKYHRGGDRRFALLVQVLPHGTALDDAGPQPSSGRDARKWHASPQARVERLLRAVDVAIGVLYNGVELRLIYAPSGESSGHLTWPLAALCEVGGRPILGALHMLLRRSRLFAAPVPLIHILRESRKYQNLVSTQLAQQVLQALNELLRGFQAANAAQRGLLLDSLLREEPTHVYGGLLASLLRMVFILFAEERDLLPSDEVYVRGYSLSGLFEKLRMDHGRFPDTMDQRYGAWTQLCVLFRLIHDGVLHPSLSLPARHGHLFDPNGWPFLEGRPGSGGRQVGARLDLPKVSDGVVYRVLEKLLILDGDRLSYRALDVEQIGSVYEGMMGYTLQRAAAVSLGVGSSHVVVDLDALLAQKPGERGKWLKEQADCDISGEAAKKLRDATTIGALDAALEKRRSALTPQPIPRGGLYLQPTDERRRSGSHYTPRELTGPIVARALAPLWAELGSTPTAEQILGLRICDPAMGSGAFLVEACRQLAEALVRAWDLHGAPADKPADEEPQMFALRLVAQRCLYGIDKNRFAVDLGKLSLWLATLAKRHSFTFVDHALRHGDSLVGLSREQIASFHWQPDAQIPTLRAAIDAALSQADALRRQIQALAHRDDDDGKARLLRQADAALAEVRAIADAVVACFFAGDSDKRRKILRREWADRIPLILAGTQGRQALSDLLTGLREGEHAVPPFHWPLEFPEVFTASRPGFDALVGNPPFAGKNNIAAGHAPAYPDWLKALHAESHGNADLVAHFFRRAFDLLRLGGTFGLIATNTIAQGDTRSTGLRWICTHDGTIFHAQKRYKWPGLAAVIVSVVHVRKGVVDGPCILDGRAVPRITAFLFHAGDHEDPKPLKANQNKSFQGSIVLGMGFTFDDTTPDATPLAEMHRLIAKDPRNQERIFPYLGGEELNDSPTNAHHRYVINFGEMTEEEAREWPDLFRIVENKVKPDRMNLANNADGIRRKTYWWQWGRYTPALFSAIDGLDRVLALSLHSQYLTLAFLSARQVFSHALAVISLDSYAAFGTLQSRPHEIWARFFGSSMKDDLRYTPTDCFETFPFPVNWESDPRLEEAGKAYYEFRAALMIRNQQGLTATYNRFHDPGEDDADIVRLRNLHDAMDRAVLDAYGWSDLTPACQFLLDYDDPEEEDEEESGRPRRKKKPWRYRWPDAIRDEVLARLLALNTQRASEEAATALLHGSAAKPTARKRAAKAKPPTADESPAPSPTNPSAPDKGGQGSLF